MCCNMTDKQIVKFLEENVGSKIIITFGKFDPKTKVGNINMSKDVVDAISDLYNKYGSKPYEVCAHMYLNKVQYTMEEDSEIHTIEIFELKSLIGTHYSCTQVKQSVIPDLEFPQINKYDDVVDYIHTCYHVDSMTLNVKDFELDENNHRYEVSITTCEEYTKDQIADICTIVDDVHSIINK
jgi:hypothetical protein